jgi:phosphoribosyl 1,2-cyclic phosphodiesterase
VGIRAGASTIVLDAGSGICGLKSLPRFKNHKYSLIFSHYHVDHIHGLLFWEALFDNQCSIDVYGMDSRLGDVRATCGAFLNDPFQPAGLNEVAAAMSFSGIGAGSVINLEGGAEVKAIALSHPGECLGLRIDYNGKSVCYFTDVELALHQNDEALFSMAANTDMVIVDSFFGVGKNIPGWGHSTAAECAAFAKKINAGRLALFHYNYKSTDSEIIALEGAAKAIFADSFAPADGECAEI